MYVIKQKDEKLPYLCQFKFLLSESEGNVYCARFSENFEYAKKFPEDKIHEAEKIINAMKILSKTDRCQDLYLARLKNVIVNEVNNTYLESITVAGVDIKAYWTKDKSQALIFNRLKVLEGTLKILGTFQESKNFKSIFI